jgi:hypothetical protein
MTVKQVLIAQQQGEVSLNDVTLNWWDSSNHRQDKATLSGLKLDVAPASLINNEVIATPNVPATETKTITVYQAGIWPYIAGLFALLWLVTLALWYRASKTKSNIETELPDSPTLDKLLNALANGNSVQANYLLNCWLDEHPQLDPAVTEKIEQQRSAMNRSGYSDSADKWQAKELITLLKKANKSSNKRSSRSETLASL